MYLIKLSKRSLLTVSRKWSTGSDDGRIQKGSDYMSEREKEIIQTVADALPKMSERDKGYFLGYAEAMASQKDSKDSTKENGSE